MVSDRRLCFQSCCLHPPASGQYMDKHMAKRRGPEPGHLISPDDDNPPVTAHRYP